MKKSVLFSIVFIGLLSSMALNVNGQGVGINPNGAPPDSSAGLDVNFTNKGFLMPRLTQVQRNSISSPALGLMIFNTTTNCFNLWTGNYWKQSCFDCDVTIAVGNNSPVCAGSTLNLTATTISGATYNWSGPAGFTSTLQNPVINNVFSVASGVYFLAVNVNGCTSNPVQTQVTVPVPPDQPASITGPSYVCANTGGFVFSATPVAGATNYTWTVPSDATINSGQGTPTITVTFGNSNDAIYVHASNFCGQSSDIYYYYNMSTTPPLSGFTTSPSPASQNSNITFASLDFGAGNTFSWTFSGGTPSTSTAKYPMVAWSTPGTYSVSLTVASSSGCTTSSSGSVTIGSTLACSGTATFTNGGIQTFAVPCSVTSLTISAYGGQGGNSINGGGVGGLGGFSQGNFAVTPGQVLYIAAGLKGYPGNGGGGWYAAGGGGGSFVGTGASLLTSTPMIVAGGGGGGACCSSSYTGGAGGTILTTSGTGNGGTGTANGGSPGAGYHGNAGYYGATAFINGGFGANANSYCSTCGLAGFGGGGSGGGNPGGGGGGYVGGNYGDASTRSGSGSNKGGMGGTSFNAGTSQTNTAGSSSGDGQVIITW